MARILILTLGSRGDVQPYIALGRVLQARGHSVTLSAGQGFAQLVPDGITYAPLSINMEVLLQTPEMQAALHGVRAKLRAFRDSRALMLQQFDEMWAVTQRAHPDAIIYHPKAFLAPYLARALGAVAIPSFLQPAFQPSRAFPNPLLGCPDLGPLSNRLLGAAMIRLMRVGYRALLKDWFPRHKAVPRLPDLDVLSGFHPGNGAPPRLYAHSACLVPKPPDWAAADRVTGDWHFDVSSDWSPPRELEAFLAAAPAPIYVGFGSMPSKDAGRMTDIVLQALRRTGQRAVLSLGWGGLEARNSSDEIYVLQEAPHDWLFPRCRAVVHHGGAGTTHGALRHGRPSLICPHFGDQSFWGARVAQLGAGPKPISVRSLTTDNLSRALDALESEDMAHRAASLATCMERETGAETAATLAEEALEAR